MLNCRKYIRLEVVFSEELLPVDIIVDLVGDHGDDNDEEDATEHSAHHRAPREVVCTGRGQSRLCGHSRQGVRDFFFKQ
jgi:hypothetical protein